MWIDKPCHQLVLVTGQSWGAKQWLSYTLRWKSSLVSLPLFPSSGALPCCVPKPVTIAVSFLSSLSLLLDSPIPTTPLFFQSKITFFKNIKLPALPMSRQCKAEACSLLWILRTSCELLSAAPLLQREFPRFWHFPQWKQWSRRWSAHLPRKLCSCARCQEGQGFSSIQGIDPKSTAQIAAPIVNSSELKKVPNLGTRYYSSSQLKSHFYEEMESNPFCFLLNKQYQRSESMYHVAWQAV